MQFVCMFTFLTSHIVFDAASKGLQNTNIYKNKSILRNCI